MLPGNALSIVTVKGEFLSPDDLVTEKLRDFEMGGIGLSNPSAGLEYQVWTLEYIVDRVFVSAPNTPRVQLFVAEGITEISLAFDQNMRPFVAFMQNLEAKYWWYNTQTATITITTLPTGSRSPKATLDDKRPIMLGLSDIILAYMRDRNLYFRAQRDRYLIEYLLATEIDADLNKIGMTNNNRVQFRMLPNV